jgi:tetratricopeptide (TPR) repeat protein
MNKLVKIFALMFVLFVWGCAYFNTFYNAIQFFEEAEQEIVSASNSEQLSNKSEELLQKTIARCNLVVAKYPESRFHDDALLLRAKALYYQGEFQLSKGSLERLNSEFPESPLLNEARLWTIRCQWKNESSKASLEETLYFIGELEKNDRFGRIQSLRSLAHTIASEIYQFYGEIDSALTHLEKSAEYAANRLDRMNAHYSIAERAYEEGRLNIALENYRKVISSHPNPKRVEMSHLQIVRIYRETKMWAEASEEIEELTTNEKFSGIKADLSLELAKLYEMQGRDDEARKRYEVITEDFPKTAASAESYFALGTAALDEEKDYPLARKYFDNVEREFRESTYAPSARVRVQEIDDLLSVTEAIEKVEVSLFGDGETKEETEKTAISVDRLLNVDLKSSVKQEEEIENITNESQDDIIDTTKLYQELSQQLYSAGELQAFRFGDTEEGMKYFIRIVNNLPSTNRTAQALYSLSYLYDISGDSVRASDLRNRLMIDYSDSEYAMEIARSQSMILADAPAELMAQSEALTDGDPEKAIELYESVLKQYPNTRYAPVVLLSMAHIYDRSLNDLDHALEVYERIASDYEKSEQAKFAGGRIALLKKIKESIADTTSSNDSIKNDR